MVELDRLKVVVAGDSGVGKTAVVNLLCHGFPLLNPSYTIGCSVDVKTHIYRGEACENRPYFIDLWDVGGSKVHANVRSVFYQNLDGLILVHDCTNSKSQINLRKWLKEIFEPDGLRRETSLVFDPTNSWHSIINLFPSPEDSSPDTHPNMVNGNMSGEVRQRSNDEIDRAAAISQRQNPSNLPVPVLVIGTKLDLLDSRTRQSIESCVRETCSYSPDRMRLAKRPITATGYSNYSLDGSVSVVLPASPAASVGQGLLSNLVFGQSLDKQCRLAAEFNLPELLMDCNSTDSVAPNSWNAVIFDKFFDDVIQSRLIPNTPSWSPEMGRSKRTASVVPAASTGLYDFFGRA